MFCKGQAGHESARHKLTGLFRYDPGDLGVNYEDVLLTEGEDGIAYITEEGGGGDSGEWTGEGGMDREKEWEREGGDGTKRAKKKIRAEHLWMDGGKGDFPFNGGDLGQET